jgi:hypothetical protein
MRHGRVERGKPEMPGMSSIKGEGETHRLVSRPRGFRSTYPSSEALSTVFACLVLTWTLTAWVGDAHAGRQSGKEASDFGGRPLRFDSEVVRLFIEPDSLTVEGNYRLLCGASKTEFTALFYPYPEDSLLGAARTVSLECRTPGGAWRSLEFVEVPGRRGARWKVPLNLGDTLEVRTVYRQSLLACYARYIVVTTRTWRRPLKEARFEIFLPEGASPVQFSFPFKLQASGECAFYMYEATDFMPDRDITVEWATEGTGKP